jgi:hypothetical protein
MELNDFPAVHTVSPLLVSPQVKYAGDTEFTQAVVATDDEVSVPIPSRVNWRIVNRRWSNSWMGLSGQIRNGVQHLLTDEFILGAVNVRGQFFWQIILRDPTHDDYSYLRKAFTHNIQKLKP